MITGAHGAFGSALKKALECKGAEVVGVHFGVDWTYSDYSKLEDKLKKADVLILSHGSKKDQAMAANCTSYLAIIDLYRKSRLQAGKPSEIWGLGSEIEFHPAWGIKHLAIYLKSKRAYAKYASKLYFDPCLTYRHIVPSGFRSRMGPGLMSAKTAVRMTLFFIRRDWKYIPVTYTGFAFLNYFRFRKLGKNTRDLTCS